jgi:hypothetical protein
MRVAFILHELNLTGAAKLGLQMARVFARNHEVALVSKKDGPLRQTIPPGLFHDVVITNTNHEICSEPLEQRVAKATAWLEEFNPDLVYVNSTAAADWLGAARLLGCRTVLHVHEMLRIMSELLVLKVFDRYDVAGADRILAASRECMNDVQACFDVPTEKITNFGVCVDVREILERSKEEPALAVRHDGRPLDYASRGERKIVAMCGLAQHRKGVDLFWEAARLTPEHDFLWIGPWDDADARETNPALALNAENPLDNLYWTNMTSNPYSIMARADLLALTSREDPNPLVVPEAIALGRPVATFASTGGAHEWTSRYGLSLSGAPDAERLSNFSRRFFSMEATAWSPNDSFFEAADLETKTLELVDSLNEAVIS